MPERTPIEKPLKRTSIQRKWVKCGKPGCTSCPHGPYLYRVWREGNKVRTEYLGPMRAPVIPELPGDAVDARRRVALMPARGHQPSRPKRRRHHPVRVGSVVRFKAPRPVWILVRGRRQFARDDAPPMKIERVGWGVFGASQTVHPYVTLVFEGNPVYHPYDTTMTLADPKGRLDRRFPAVLLEVIKPAPKPAPRPAPKPAPRPAPKPAPKPAPRPAFKPSPKPGR